MQHGGQDGGEIPGLMHQDAGGANQVTDEGNHLFTVQAVRQPQGEIVSGSEPQEVGLGKALPLSLPDQLLISQ